LDINNYHNLTSILKTLSVLKKERGNLSGEKNLPDTPAPVRELPKILNIDANFKAQALNRMEQAAFLRELLNLPKDIREILAFLAGKDVSAELLTTLLKSETIKITPEMLQKLLESNSKEVISKLIKLLQQPQQNAQNYDQLKQMMALLNQFVPTKDATAQEVLTRFLLLYLPWLPLMEHQKVEVAFEKRKSASDEEDEQLAVVIYVSTINLGRFKITIMVNKVNKPDILIENISESGEKSEEQAKALENILKTVNKEIKEDKIEAKTYLSVIKQENHKETPERKVTITKMSPVSPLALVIAQKIARIILEADEKISLLQKRQEMA